MAGAVEVCDVLLRTLAGESSLKIHGWRKVSLQLSVLEGVVCKTHLVIRSGEKPELCSMYIVCPKSMKMLEPGYTDTNY